jgi:hypothetical protein
MHFNSIAVKSNLIALLAAGLTVSSLAGLSQPAVSAEASTSPALAQTSIDTGREAFGRALVPEAFAPSQITSSYLISPAQDEFIANALLMFLYLVLPAGFGVALWQHDKRYQERLAKFTLQVVALERIWEQESQV